MNRLMKNIQKENSILLNKVVNIIFGKTLLLKTKQESVGYRMFINQLSISSLFLRRGKVKLYVLPENTLTLAVEKPMIIS